MAFRCIALALVLLLSSLVGVSSESTSALRPLHASTWTATDALGRSLPSHAQVGDRRPDKTVGVFYFICQEHGRTGPWDNTRLLAAAGGNRSAVQYGPLYEAHHWGEPLYGYYTSDDPWVTAKHGSLLADAGVDFVFLDITNAVTYGTSTALTCWQRSGRLTARHLTAVRSFSLPVRPRVAHAVGHVAGDASSGQPDAQLRLHPAHGGERHHRSHVQRAVHQRAVQAAVADVGR